MATSGHLSPSGRAWLHTLAAFRRDWFRGPGEADSDSAPVCSMRRRAGTRGARHPPQGGINVGELELAASDQQRDSPHRRIPLRGSFHAGREAQNQQSRNAPEPCQTTSLVCSSRRRALPAKCYFVATSERGDGQNRLDVVTFFGGRSRDPAGDRKLSA